jgi:hypothetical protein
MGPTSSSAPSIANNYDSKPLNLANSERIMYANIGPKAASINHGDHVNDTNIPRYMARCLPIHCFIPETTFQARKRAG